MKSDWEARSKKRNGERTLFRYGLATLITAPAICLALRLPLGPETGSVLCFGAVVLTALYAGLGPAILSLSVSTAALSSFLFPGSPQLPFLNADLEDLTRLGIFIMIALMTSCFVAGSRQANRRLRASNAWHQDMMRSAPNAIVSTTESEEILFVNPAAEAALGCPASQMLGQNLNRVLAKTGTRIDELQADERRARDIQPPTFPRPTEDGKPFYAQIPLTVLRHPVEPRSLLDS